MEPPRTGEVLRGEVVMLACISMIINMPLLVRVEDLLITPDLLA